MLQIHKAIFIPQISGLCVFSFHVCERTAASIWFCLLSTLSRNVSWENTWIEGKTGEEVVVSALLLAL